jgi:hypothetical protein
VPSTYISLELYRIAILTLAFPNLVKVVDREVWESLEEALFEFLKNFHS